MSPITQVFEPNNPVFNPYGFRQILSRVKNITQFSVFENSSLPAGTLTISAARTFERTSEKDGCGTDLVRS